MSDRPIPHSPDRSADFLLAEYGQMANSFWKNEEVGEKRVTFFITLVTAVISALVALATSDADIPIYPVAALALLGLLLVGWITLLRMITRSLVTDEYKRVMKIIRDAFRAMEGGAGPLQTYHPFTFKPRTFKMGSLVGTVVLMNSLVGAALCLAVASLLTGSREPSDPAVAVNVLAGLAGGGIAQLAQVRYVTARYKNAAAKQESA